MAGIINKNQRKQNRAADIIIFSVLSAGAVTMVFPFFWMLSTALKDSKSVFAYPPTLIPYPLIWQNFIDIWRVVPLFNGLKNSFIVSSCVVLFGTVSSTMAAFSYSKLRFPCKNLFFMLLLSTMMIPFAVLLIPLFVMYSAVGWIDTLLPLIVPGMLGNVTMIFFLRQFMNGLPNELMESAKIDGCGYPRIYAGIYLPLCGPAIAANVILLFMATWNDYLGPLIFTHSPSIATVQVVIASFNTFYKDQMNFAFVMAASLIAILPVLILFITCQKYFVDSFVMSGIKG